MHSVVQMDLMLLEKLWTKKFSLHPPSPLKKRKTNIVKSQYVELMVDFLPKETTLESIVCMVKDGNV